MNKRVLFLRSTSIIDDSRSLKEIEALVKAGYQVSIYGWDRKRKQPHKTISFHNGTARLDYCSLPCNYGGGLKNLFKMLGFQHSLAKYLKKHKETYDIIHSCDLDTGMVAVKYAKKYQKELVYDIFDYYIDAHSFSKPIAKFLEKQEIKTINQADVTIICTEQREKQIAKAHPKKLIVIHNTPNIPTNLDQIKFKIQGDKHNIKVVYVGVLQDHRLLKEILEQLKGNDKIELHIGGFGVYENDLEQMAKEYSNIYFYGSMEYLNVLKLESQADILFATYDPQILNHKYSAPNKIYEAMALGKPIIVCKGTGIDKVVTTNHFGVAIPYDSKAFEKAIMKIMKNNYKTEEIKKVYSLYHWDIMEQRLIQAYKEL